MQNLIKGESIFGGFNVDKDGWEAWHPIFGKVSGGW